MKIAISGGTGLVGSAITKILLEEGNEVIVLTTRKDRTSTRHNLYYSYWNPSEGIVDNDTITQCDAIINLAGANLAQRWSNSYKDEILSSRVDSTQLLVKLALSPSAKIKHFVSTSAVGYYPSNSAMHKEDAQPGENFLSKVCVLWEESVAPLLTSDIFTSILRVGVVISTEGGALPKLLPIFKLGLGSPVGSGEQYMSPIHIDDLASLYVHAICNNWNGTFNAVGDDTPTNKEFSQILANALNRPFFLPKIPAFLVRIAFGEMSTIVLSGQRASNEKMTINGFQLTHRTAREQLEFAIIGK